MNLFSNITFCLNLEFYAIGFSIQNNIDMYLFFMFFHYFELREIQTKFEKLAPKELNVNNTLLTIMKINFNLFLPVVLSKFKILKRFHFRFEKEMIILCRLCLHFV